MSAGTWGGRAIDPKVREAALDAARRHNIQLGGWLGEALQTAVRDDADEDPVELEERRGASRRVADAIERLALRIESAERRASQAVEGLDRTVVDLASRIDDTETGAREEALRLFALVGELKTAQETLIERLARADGPERIEQIRAAVEGIESEAAKLAARVEADMERIAARLDANDAARERTHDALHDVELALRSAVDDVDARLSGRIADAHAAAFGRLDELAAEVTCLEEARVEDAETVGRGFDALESRMSERLADLRASVERAADQADAAERAAEEAARTFAETLSEFTTRIDAVQARSDASIERVAGEMRAALDARTEALAGAIDDLKASFDGVVENLRTDQLEAGLAEANRRISKAEVLQDQTIEAVSVEIKRLSEAFDRRMRALEDSNQKLDLPRLIEKVQASSDHKLAAVDARALQAAAALSTRLDALGADLAAARSDISKHVAAAAAELDVKLQARLDGALDEIDQRLATAAYPAEAPAQQPSSAETTSALAPMAEAMPSAQDRAPLNQASPEPALTERPIADVAEAPPSAPAEPRPFVIPKVQGLYVTASQITPRASKPAPPPPQDPPPAPAAALGSSPTKPAPRPDAQPDRWDAMLDDDFPIDLDPAEPLGETAFIDDFDDDRAAQAFERFHSESAAARAAEPAAEPDLPPRQPQAAAPQADDEAWSLPDDADAPPKSFGAARAPHAEPRSDVGSERESLLESDPDLDLDILESEPPPMPPRRNDYISEARRAAMLAAQPTKPKKSIVRSPAVVIAGALGVAAAGGAALMLRPAEPTHETATQSPPPAAPSAPAPPGSIAEAAAQLAQEPAPAPAAPQITLEAAAERGDSVAIYEFARQKLASGASDEGFSLMRKAAEKGLAAAQYRLAKLFERGEGTPADIAAARQWTERAALGGNRSAMHDLGVYYARGEGVTLNEAQAYRWFRQAADLGMTNSQYNLGVLYQTGRGVAADPEEALFWFSVAAASSDSDAAARAASIASRLAPETVSQIDARAAAFRPRPMNPRANGDFGPQPWASPASGVVAAPRG